MRIGFSRRRDGEFKEAIRHRWPRLTTLGIDAVVSIAGAVRDPAGGAAIGHRHRHHVAARRGHVPERRLVDDRLQRAQDISLEREGIAVQKHGAVGHDFAKWVTGSDGIEQVVHDGVASAANAASVG